MHDDAETDEIVCECQPQFHKVLSGWRVRQRAYDFVCVVG